MPKMDLPEFRCTRCKRVRREGDPGYFWCNRMDESWRWVCADSVTPEEVAREEAQTAEFEVGPDVF
jgi:hypothetical protein